jgi:solute carrier family 13 (sodium-dependent dicarboxylate transporter), member 2/3/5
MEEKSAKEILVQKLKSVLYFFGILVAAAGLTWLIKEPGFTDSQVYVLFLLFFSIGLWVTEIIPPFSVALLIIAFLVFALGNKDINSNPEKIDIYVNTFSSSIIWLMLGGFFLASAMTKTKLDEALFRFTLKISGTKPRNLVIGLMVTTMIASMLMSNTATTAIVIAAVMPLLNSLGKKSGLTKAILLGIPIAASTGGMATIIGSPPNAIAAGILEAEGVKIDFLDWMIYGTPICLILTAIGAFMLIKVFIKDKTHISLVFLDDQKAELTPELRSQRRIVIVIILVTVILWLTSSLHGLKVASIAAVPLVFLTLTGVLSGKDIRALPWDTLLLVAGGLSLGVALQNTGLLGHYADKLKQIDLNYVLLAFVFAYVTMIFSNIMSHTATSTVMIPLGMVILSSMKMDVAVIIALAASSALFLPVSTPPNAIVYSTGLIEQKDFRIGGVIIGLIGPALMVIWMLLI